LFDAAEAGDQERYDKILDEIENKAKNMRTQLEIDSDEDDI